MQKLNSGTTIYYQKLSNIPKKIYPDKKTFRVEKYLFTEFLIESV